MRIWISCVLMALLSSSALSQGFRPPAFAGGIPGATMFQAIQMQRHQARTLLYREALEELRKNPAAADVPECPSGYVAPGTLCLRQPQPEAAALPQPPAAVAQLEMPATPVKPIVAAVAPAPVAPPPAVKPTLAPSPVIPPAVAPSPVSTAPAPQASPVKPVVAAVAPTPVAMAPVPQPTPVKPVVAPAPEPAPAIPTVPTPSPKVGRRLAVLFGNNDYKTPIPELETPIADVSKTAEVLQARFGFDARVVKNASKAQIIEALNQIATNATPDDSVLLFYAGHGYLMDDTNMGFWIPVDASVKTAANWISNTDISKLLAAIRARQIILVSDSCFSGSLTREQKIAGGTSRAEDVLLRRSVVVLSSGGDEPVSDEGKDGHSIFAYTLIKTLNAASGTTPGYEIWRTVHKGVRTDYQQEPQYGAVVSAGHSEGGEYLFQAR